MRRRTFKYPIDYNKKITLSEAAALAGEKSFGRPADASKRIPPQHLRIERPIRVIVSELVAVLGAPLVAVIAGEKSVSAVEAWCNGEAQPAAGDSLRNALYVAELLKTREENDVIRAWFGGVNHLLDDQNPALMLATNDPAAWSSVIKAAQAFVAN